MSEKNQKIYKNISKSGNWNQNKPQIKKLC